MTTPVFQLNGETAIITGGGSGLGFGMAHCFVESGAKVVLVGRRETVLQQACAELGEAASYETFDVCRFEEVDNLVQRITDRVGPPTILVNNAGVHLKKLATETTVDEFDKVMRTHVLAAQALSRAVLPGMIERRHGNLLFIASMTSLIGMPQVVAYSAAKSAYVGMVRTLAVEVSQHNVRVNAIAPGWIDTPMLHKAIDGDQPRINKILGRTPMQRFGTVNDIGWAATYLCSPAAQFVTGVLLPVDGGASIGF
ncbi:MAG: SDR family oxidoreductase [Pirellulales bacterium]|nr:SDR family oxidoreductase [Pirellulales bacterium]